jgi:GDPmannose 4,6-dehydratase
MWLMLQQDCPDVYVIGTGETHSVREFCQHAFENLGLDYQQFVIQDENLLRPKEKIQLVANTSRAKELLGWEATTHFRNIVEIMVSADFDFLQKDMQINPYSEKFSLNGNSSI